jgi:hypothetical protein
MLIHGDPSGEFESDQFISRADRSDNSLSFIGQGMITRYPIFHLDRFSMSINPLRIAAVILPAFLAWGCAQMSNLAAWEHYDVCAKQLTSFSAMVGCGRERLKAYCQTRPSEPACGALGNAVAAYADNLERQIEDKQITEPEARRKWAQFELLSPAEQVRTSQAATAAGR